jgi:MFS family permease
LVAVAIPLLALTLTRNPLLIAGVTAVNRGGAAIAALPGGVIADRWDRRRVMVACNVAAGLTLLALVVALTSGRAELVMLYAVAAVLAACEVTYTLAAQATLPDLVPSDQLALANGRLIAIEGAGEQFLGPASGGILFSLARRLPFFVDGVSFLISALLVRKNVPSRPRRELRRISPGGEGAGDEGAGDAVPDQAEALAADGQGITAGVCDDAAYPDRVISPPPGWTAGFREGLRVFGTQSPLKLLAANMSALAFCQNMVFALLVLYGKTTLHLTSTGYGLFVAFASLLGMAGAFSGGALQRRFGSNRLIIGGTAAAAVSFVGLAFTTSSVLAVFVFGLQEVGTALANVGSVTTRQHVIPRQLFGRVGSVHRLAVTTSSAVGAILAGLIASVSSVSATMLTAGLLLMLMVVLLAPALFRKLADVRS